jgi:hypothetical protein
MHLLLQIMNNIFIQLHTRYVAIHNALPPPPRDNKMYKDRCKDKTALNQAQAVVAHLFVAVGWQALHP